MKNYFLIGMLNVSSANFCAYKNGISMYDISFPPSPIICNILYKNACNDYIIGNILTFLVK